MTFNGGIALRQMSAHATKQIHFENMSQETNTQIFRRVYFALSRKQRQLTRIAWMAIYRPDLAPAINDNPPAWVNRLDGRTPVTDSEVNWIENFDPLIQTTNQIN
jgi:hypothetical protein